MARSKRLEIIFHNGEPEGIRIYMRHMSTIKAFVIEEQIKIAEYFKKIDDLISASSIELEKLQALKKSLLEKMFT